MKTAFLISPSCDVFVNLAAERRLMERPGADVTLMLWRNAPTVVISAQQLAHEECRCERLAEYGAVLARRSSGGGAVYHDLGNLNFSFICKERFYEVDRQLSVVADALAEFGILTEATGRNDLGAGGMKFSGNAFYHLHGVRCHHGTVLVNCNIEAMERLLTPGAAKLARHGAESVRARVVNLAQLDAKASVDSVAAALERSFIAEYGAPEEQLRFPEVSEADTARYRVAL